MTERVGLCHKVSVIGQVCRYHLCCKLEGYTRTALFYIIHITLQLNSKLVSCLSTRNFITVRDVSASLLKWVL